MDISIHGTDAQSAKVPKFLRLHTEHTIWTPEPMDKSWALVFSDGHHALSKGIETGRCWRITVFPIGNKMSDETEFLTCFCNQCGQKLEFPSHAAGTEIQCPTCSMTTLLFAQQPIPTSPPIRPGIKTTSVSLDVLRRPHAHYRPSQTTGSNSTCMCNNALGGSKSQRLTVWPTTFGVLKNSLRMLEDSPAIAELFHSGGSRVKTPLSFVPRK
jgi:DNA-directed RNA polymerase subunit RPC12/RpoP